jgi:hypothetical protein
LSGKGQTEVVTEAVKEKLDRLSSCARRRCGQGWGDSFMLVELVNRNKPGAAQFVELPERVEAIATPRPVNLSSASIRKGVGRTKSFCSKIAACDSV